MIRLPFSAGVMVDVLSHQGQSYLAYAEVGAGLVVRWWADGHPDQAEIVFFDVDVTTHGFPRLAVAGGVPHVLYRRDEPVEAVVDADLVVNHISPWEVPCWGNSPCAWGPAETYAVQTDAKRIVAGRWPDEPTADAGPARPTGLSHHNGTHWVLWDKVQGPEAPDFDPTFQERVEIDGAACGVTGDDRLVLEIDGVRGFVPGAEGAKRPRLARQADGRLLVAYHVEGSQVPTEVVVYANVTASDLVAERPMPPLEAVVQVNRPLLVGFFDFADSPGWGNVSIPIRQSRDRFRSHPCVIATADDLDMLGPDQELFAIWAGEGGGGRTETILEDLRAEAVSRGMGLAAFQDDDRPWRPTITANMRPGDLRLMRTFWEPGETKASVKARTKARSGDTDHPVVAIIGVHRRATATHPGLTDREIAEMIIVASELAAELGWLGVIFFRLGLSDGPSTLVLPYLDRFISGVTGRPDRPAVGDPSEPEPDPEPEPEPNPEPAPKPAPAPTFPRATRFPERPMRYILRDTLRSGQHAGQPASWLSVEPGRNRVEYRPDTPTGGWEAAEVLLDGTQATVRFLDANQVLAVTPDGRYQVRPAGTAGPWERFEAAEQPDGRLTVIRWEGDCIVACFQAEPLG